MFVALDKDGNRAYADLVDEGIEALCPVCGEKLRLRKGTINKPHFAHFAKTDCRYGEDKDYKSEWHIRMQEYFPRECREVRFVDNETGEVHIADVFLKDSNTVLEFQKSKISEEEYKSRTKFHYNAGRRIVWLFDESSSDPESPMGRFRPSKVRCRKGGLEMFQWMRRPRKFLSNIPNLKKFSNRYSVCVYFGTEGDIFHRIIETEDDFGYVLFSATAYVMSPDMNIDEFFEYDAFWQWEDEVMKNNFERQKKLLESQSQIVRFSRPVRRSRRW